MKPYCRLAVVIISFFVVLLNEKTSITSINEEGCGLTMVEIAKRKTVRHEPRLGNKTRVEWIGQGTNLSGEYRVTGGQQTPRGAWPWIVQFLNVYGQHRCGGSLIDPNFVLTAAHCFVKDRRPTSYSVRVGGHTFGYGRPHRVNNISIHPLFNTSIWAAYDFAIVRISPPVKTSTRPICLPRLPAIENRLCVVAGWGYMSAEAREFAPHLREIRVPTISTEVCSQLPNYIGRIHLPSMLCAGYSYGKIDSCQGDSGGPLMCARDGHWELTGVVSWGRSCGQPGMPGIYANVHAASAWIDFETSRLRN